MTSTVRRTQPTRRLFTVDEYHQMSELGILPPEERTELMDGEILLMASVGGPHLWCINRLTAALVPRAGERAVVSVQNPVRLTDLRQPEPDIALLRPGSDAGEAVPLAADVLLLIEVSDTTFTFDNGPKLIRYAEAAIPEVWIVDLPGARVLVYRDPAGDVYRQATEHRRGETLAPLAFPDLTITVDTILG